MARSIDRTVRLPSGRTLGYLELGEPDAPAVFLLHGSPGSRLDAAFVASPVLDDLSVRIIAPDRPGIGLSDPQPGRTFLDGADDVRSIADALGLERFAVVGVSGGGPYAAACAHELGPRLSSVAIVSGLAPLDVPGNTKGMGSNRHYFRLARRAPWLVRALMGPLGAQLSEHPDKTMKRVVAAFAKPDRTLMAECPPLRDAFRRSLLEVYRQGPDGMVRDMALYAEPWGFDPAAITVDVQIWQGDADTNVPLAMAKWWARTIDGARLHVLPGEGHFMFVAHIREILSELLERRERAPVRRAPRAAGRTPPASGDSSTARGGS